MMPCFLYEDPCWEAATNESSRILRKKWAEDSGFAVTLFPQDTGRYSKQLLCYFSLLSPPKVSLYKYFVVCM